MSCKTSVESIIGSAGHQNLQQKRESNVNQDDKRELTLTPASIEPIRNVIGKISTKEDLQSIDTIVGTHSSSQANREELKTSPGKSTGEDTCDRKNILVVQY